MPSLFGQPQQNNQSSIADLLPLLLQQAQMQGMQKNNAPNLPAPRQPTASIPFQPNIPPLQMGGSQGQQGGKGGKGMGGQNPFPQGWFNQLFGGASAPTADQMLTYGGLGDVGSANSIAAMAGGFG